MKYKKFSNFRELNKELVRKLINKKIIAVFRNDMEFGSRALGNTSIICDPRLLDAKKIINSKVKLREKFRPFAPSILEKEVNKWFEGSVNSPYMSFVLKFKKDKRKLVPAVCHVDDTGRLQTLTKNFNEPFYDLIKKFEKKTNIPILLNTSFNKNEPIVESQKSAIETFRRTSIDFLNIDDYLISK